MVKNSTIARIVNDAVKGLATLFEKKSPRKNVQLSIECLEEKLLLTGMALLPQRPILSDGGILTELSFTPFGQGLGVFRPGDSYTTSNQGSFSYIEQGYLSTNVEFEVDGQPVSYILSQYTIEIDGAKNNSGLIFTGSIEYTYDFSYNGEDYIGGSEVTFAYTTGYRIDNILYSHLVSSVLSEVQPSLFTRNRLTDVIASSTGTFSYSYEISGTNSVIGSGTNSIPFLPLGHTGVDSYQYSGTTTYTIDKAGTGTVVADNWFKIDGAASYSTLPDEVLALVCYSYEKDATLSVTSSATTVFSSNGTSSLLFSTQETFSASGSQAGGSYSYSNNYSSSGRETYAYSGTQTQIYNERAQGSWAEDSSGTYFYSGSTPIHTSLQDSLVESVGGTYSLNKYEQRAITNGTGQRLSTFTADNSGSTSNGKLLTDGSASSDATRSDSYSFSGTAGSTISYAGTATSTWNRPQSFTQSETYTYSASYQESRSGSGSSLQTMLSAIEAGSTFSHSGFTFTQEGVISNRELQSRSYSETSATTSSISGLGNTNLYQGGMPASGSPSMSSFTFSANGTSSLLAYESTGTMNFSGTATARETYSSNDTTTLNRQSPFLETITSSGFSNECYTSNSTFNISSGVLQRSSLASYTESFSQSAQGTYAGQSYNLSSVTFDSITTGSNYYSETQSYNITTGTFNGTHNSYEQSIGTLTATGPATLLGVTSSGSSLYASSSYSYHGSSTSNALVNTQYSESNSRRGTYSQGSYSYQSLVNHSNGVRNTAYESTDIQEITYGLATYQAYSWVSQSSSETSGNNGLVSAITGNNNDSSTGTTTLFFTQYNIHNLEGTSRVTFGLHEYGSSSHMTLSLTSINYQESASGLVTSTLEQRNYSTSLLTTSDSFSYGANTSISLTGSATGIVYNSSVRSGDAAGCITSSSAGRFRYEESRSTLTSSQVTDYVYSNHVLGEYLNGKYSYSSMAYQSTSSISSLATAYSVNTLANKDKAYLRDAVPAGNSSSIGYDPNDASLATTTSSSIGNSAITSTNDVRRVSTQVSTNESHHLEAYSSLGVYSNFSTSITSFANHSSGHSLSTMNSIETLTGSIVESSLNCYSLSNGNSGTSGGPIQNSSGGNGDGRLVSSITTTGYLDSTAGYIDYVITSNVYSQLEYESHREGEIPYNLETELTLYESIVSAASQYNEQEVGAIGRWHTQSQSSGVVSDSSGSSIVIPNGMTDVTYDSRSISNSANQSLSIEVGSVQTVSRVSGGQQTQRSYEYGTYSDGDYNLTSASYYQNSSSSSGGTYTTSTVTDVTRNQVSSSIVNGIAMPAGSIYDPYSVDLNIDSHVTNLHSEKLETISFSSTQSNTQLQRGVYSHGSYSFSCIAYDSTDGSSSTSSSHSTYSSSTTQAGQRSIVDIVGTLGMWNSLYHAYGFIMSGWYANFTQSMSETGTNNSTTSSTECYTSTIRGISSGYDFSFSLISNTYDSVKTDTYSSGSSSSSTFTGEHTTAIDGVFRSITGVAESGSSSLGTNTVHVNKQHVGAMINGVATILYDKTTIDTSESTTNGSYQGSTLEGTHSDFEVYSYNYSGVTVTSSQSTHDFTQVAFDPVSGNPWSLVSYNSIITVSNGVTSLDETEFEMSHTWTFVTSDSVSTTNYSHNLTRNESDSSVNTLAYHTRGHGTPDGSGGYSFVFDHYSVSNTTSIEGEYSNSGSATQLSTGSSTWFGASSDYSHYDWNKERTRSGSFSETKQGYTSGATFQYTAYSINDSMNDNSEYEGHTHFYDTSWWASNWGRDTLTYVETMQYDYNVDPDSYTYNIEYDAPWTLTSSGAGIFGAWGPYSSYGNVSYAHDDEGEEEKKTPAPVSVNANLEVAKDVVYVRLAAPKLPSPKPAPKLPVNTNYVQAGDDDDESPPSPVKLPPTIQVPPVHGNGPMIDINTAVLPEALKRLIANGKGTLIYRGNGNFEYWIGGAQLKFKVNGPVNKSEELGAAIEAERKKWGLQGAGWRLVFILEYNGKYREIYISEAADLDKLKGRISEDDLKKLRGILKGKFQGKTSPEIMQILKAVFGNKKISARTPTGNFNPGKTNAGANSAGTAMKNAGRVFMVFMLYDEYKKIRDADDWKRQLGSSSSGIVGSVITGWAAGAAVGFAASGPLKAHPWVLAGSTLLGGLVGGIVGYELFSGGYEHLYDIIVEDDK